MKRSRIYISVAALLSLCVSCNKNEEIAMPQGDESAIVVTTRSSDGTQTSSWAEGTELMLNDVMYTYSSGEWSYITALEWGTGTIEQLEGYIVKDGVSSGSVTLGVEGDVVDQSISGLDSYDYLYYTATNVEQPNDGNSLSINLEHIMAQVVVTVDSSSKTIAGLAIDSPMSMTLTGDEWSPVAEILSVSAELSSSTSGVYTYTANVIPNEWNTPQISLSIEGQEDPSIATYTGSITLEAGNIYRLKVVIEADGTATIVSNVNVSPWGTTTDLGTTTAIMVWDGTIAEEYGGGDGTSIDSPYLINTPAQLAFLANEVNNSANKNYYKGEYFKLNADMSLAGYEWIPIGNSTSVGFSGYFDGADHTISNLTISGTEANALTYVGLFGGLYGYATIDALTIEDASVVLSQEATTTITGLGLLAGYVNNNNAISNCNINGGTIDDGGSSSITYVGGFAGSVNNINNSFDNCHVEGLTIESEKTAGGIAGLVSNTSTYTACSVNMTITALTMGGLIGNDKGAVVTACYTAGSYKGKTAGGIAGIFAGTATGCYSTASITPKTSGTVAAIYASGDSASLNYCYPENTTSSEAIEAGTISADNVLAMNTALDGTGYKYVASEGTFPYVISAVAE